MTSHASLRSVRAIAAFAGERILAARTAGDFQVHTKPDASPQSRADREASALIVEALAGAFGESVVSEEQQLPWPERHALEALWLVDPLDGSREYVAGSDEFVVSIARIERGVPTHGVLYQPTSGIAWTAIRGEGALRHAPGAPPEELPIHTPPAPVVALSRHHDVPATRRFAELHGYTRFSAVGSALKFAHLAEGTLAVYPRFTECKEWDTAAGHLILTEAGGGLRDLVTETELRYNKPEFPNNAFLACAPGVDLDVLFQSMRSMRP